MEPERTVSSPLLLAQSKLGIRPGKAKATRTSLSVASNKRAASSADGKATSFTSITTNASSSSSSSSSPGTRWQQLRNSLPFMRPKRSMSTTTMQVPTLAPLAPRKKNARPASDFFFHASESPIYQPTRYAASQQPPPSIQTTVQPLSIYIEPGSPSHSVTSSRSSSIKTPRCHFDMALDAKMRVLDANGAITTSPPASPTLDLPLERKNTLDDPLVLDDAPPLKTGAFFPIIRSVSSYFSPTLECADKKRPLATPTDNIQLPATVAASFPSSPTCLPTTTVAITTKPHQRRSYRQRLSSSFDSPLLLPTRSLGDGIKKRAGDTQQQKEREAVKSWQLAIYLMVQQHTMIIPPAAPANSTKDHSTLRKFIINEIYTTEQSYQQLLLLAKARYMVPMMEASQAKRPVVDANDIPLLFTHLSELLQMSKKVLKTVAPTGGSEVPWYDQPLCHLGQPWLQLKDDWPVFIKYALHYQANIKHIRKLCNHLFLVKIDQECLTRYDSKRLGLADYLIAPIQRVPRYCLLLKDLLRHTPSTEDDYDALCLLVEMMSSLANTMNDSQRLYRRKTTTV